jgi:hypothetical protein
MNGVFELEGKSGKSRLESGLGKSQKKRDQATLDPANTIPED